MTSFHFQPKYGNRQSIGFALRSGRHQFPTLLLAHFTDVLWSAEHGGIVLGCIYGLTSLSKRDTYPNFKWLSGAASASHLHSLNVCRSVKREIGLSQHCSLAGSGKTSHTSSLSFWTSLDSMCYVHEPRSLGPCVCDTSISCTKAQFLGSYDFSIVSIP